MSVRAKFTCSSVIENGYNKTANFYAVYDSKGENASFSKATPSGQLGLAIDKETPAADFFEQGKNYYLDITEAPAQ